MKEADVQAAFVGHLVERGWDVVEGDRCYVDVIAKRGSERLLVEVKGKTSSPGLDVDTMYGQILRRVDGNEMTRYAIVVPETVLAAAQRVSSKVRRDLDLDLYAVDDFGRVRLVE